MRRPHHYAVVVGINDYPGISPLLHARSDAEAFAKWLKAPNGGGLPRKNVELITAKRNVNRGKTRAEAVPIAKQVFEALDKFRLAVDAKIEGDPDLFDDTRLYFFVSGHGIAPQAGDAALLMADAGDDYYDNNVSCDELIGFFEKRQYFKELVVFADCCRQVPGDECAPGRPPWTRRVRNYGGVHKLWGFATTYQDVALEPGKDSKLPLPDDRRRGYFTTALLEALAGKAVNPDTGHIDSAIVRTYVKGRVKKLTRRRQDPEFVSNELVVFRPGKAKRRKVTIRFPQSYRNEVVLTRGTRKVIDGRKGSARPWVVRLEDDLYRVKPATGTSNPFSNGGMFAVEGEDRDVRL